MPHFTPNFKDPSSRGWGGITCIAWLGSVGWASFGFILLVSVLYNDRDLSSFLIGSAWLWLPLWLAAVCIISGRISPGTATVTCRRPASSAIRRG